MEGYNNFFIFISFPIIPVFYIDVNFRKKHSPFDKK